MIPEEQLSFAEWSEANWESPSEDVPEPDGSFYDPKPLSEDEYEAVRLATDTYHEEKSRR